MEKQTMRTVRYAVIILALLSLPSGISAIEQNPTRDPVDNNCRECIRNLENYAECGDIAQWGDHSSWSGCVNNSRVCYAMPGAGTYCEPDCGSRCSSI
jgi:hypothetical protein